MLRALAALQALTAVISVASRVPADAILLRDIGALTFHGGAETVRGGRTPPLPQLTCVGTACAAHALPTLQCIGVGTDDRGAVQWRCDASVPEQYVLGDTVVSCEGYTHAHDAWVRVGSCAATYRLDVNPAYAAAQAERDAQVRAASAARARADAEARRARGEWHAAAAWPDGDHQAAAALCVLCVVALCICTVVHCVHARPVQDHWGVPQYAFAPPYANTPPHTVYVPAPVVAPSSSYSSYATRRATAAYPAAESTQARATAAAAEERAVRARASDGAASDSRRRTQTSFGTTDVR